jgi:FixJ family two-component response regulator
MNGPGREWYRKRSPAYLAGVTFVWPLFSRDAMSTQTKTVAVVDDDRSMLVGVKRLLNAYGYATKVFPSAEAFLAPGAETDADCLLLDVDLSGMSGIELRRRLAACGRAVPVIFMTALDDEATRASALETGCIAYLLKPFPSRSLIDAVKTAVAREELFEPVPPLYLNWR